MAFFSRQAAEPVPEAETNVWSCDNEECAGWMRQDFSFSSAPECPLCHSSMRQETRMLPVIHM
ncbi:cold-shock protein [Xylanibacillus composti]|uniref:Cold-shock protein n=1 Tax=Xylanibacillus composti TaxID=1572762 RepID=A0A8J4M2N1_9BACL|nr:cold-shock protein [Xylanibacillus composti]MDT9724157.1 cold-shock protein [Xylanibacillus composti]GIQ68706.1 hypothetical protein XYCOK13_15300 [Xylanibacillus composti]